MGDVDPGTAVPRLPPPRRPSREAAVKRWFGGAKRRLGYYAARRRIRESGFRRSLRRDDVFLVGHPKSGNTWLAYMLAILLEEDPGDRINLYNVGEFVPFVHARDHAIAEYEHLPDPRVFRNEFPQHPHLYPRTLYLMRDPRAALVSFWHMYRTIFDDRAMTLSTFVARYLEGADPFTYWNRHLVRWDRQVAAALDAADAGRRVAIVRYEDLVTDRERSIREIAAFIGLTSLVDDADGGSLERRILDATERGSFEAMREIEDRHGSEAYVGRARGTGRFVRRGGIDAWRSEMNEAVAARVEGALGAAMLRAGYAT